MQQFKTPATREWPAGKVNVGTTGHWNVRSW